MWRLVAKKARAVAGGLRPATALTRPAADGRFHQADEAGLIAAAGHGRPWTERMLDLLLHPAVGKASALRGQGVLIFV
ncbi:hypothetical protein [Streptomyces pratensis]|uniref:hypothetical protein n=1 Tax=Streptomyces pratensis TaxID=1169025 RepID=UPI0030161725